MSLRLTIIFSPSMRLPGCKAPDASGSPRSCRSSLSLSANEKSVMASVALSRSCACQDEVGAFLIGSVIQADTELVVADPVILTVNMYAEIILARAGAAIDGNALDVPRLRGGLLPQAGRPPPALPFFPAFIPAAA